MKLTRLGGALALALFSCAPVMAQIMTGQADGSSIPITGAKLVDKAGVEKGTTANPLVISSNGGTGGTSADATGSVTTANTYQPVFAANAARNACLIINTSAYTELVKYGAGTIAPVPAGGSFTCNLPGYVERSAILITSTVVSSTFAASVN